MYKRGQLIVVDGNIYEYDRYDADLKIHIAIEIEVDEYGHLTCTYIPLAFTDAELANSEAKFTQQQWCGIVECLIRQAYDLTNEEIDDAVEDIVGRCFTYRIPNMHELEDYIAEYMNR